MEAEIIRGHAIQAQTEAEISQSVATAKRYPRDEELSIARVASAATSSEKLAESCHYSLPKGGKQMEGPSIRFAEILAYHWGNCRYVARVLDTEGDSVVCQGLFVDSEANTQCGKEVRRRVTDRNGVRYSDEMVNTTANAGCSIAMRNAILSGIPEAMWRPAYEAVLSILRGKVGSASRDKAFAWFAERGVDEAMVLKHLGVRTRAEVSDEQIVQLRGLSTAIRDGAASVDEVFGDHRATAVEIQSPIGKAKKRHPRETADALIRAHSIPDDLVQQVKDEMGITGEMSAEQAREFIAWVEKEFI